MSVSYSSIIHAMIWGVVYTSGAGTSLETDRNAATARMYARARRSFSPSDIVLGLQVTPPLAPPSGMSTTDVFQVIHAASARTVSMVSSGCQRRPPLVGPRAELYCTR